MGFSLTGTHVIYFIAAVIVAGLVSGVFVAVIQDVSVSFSERGARVKDQLDIEFKIINDPNNIPSTDIDYIFYLKNIGSVEIPTTNQTFNVFIDGEIIGVDNYNFTATTVQPESTVSLYIDKSEIGSGDQKLRLIGPQAIEDDFTFTI